MRRAAMAECGGDVEFADALDAALKASRMPLAEVREQLLSRGESVSVATLSYWRSGARRPDPHRSSGVLMALEEILRTPPGALSGRTPGRSRRLGAVGRGIEKPSPSSEVFRILGDLDVTPVENYRTLSITETLDIDGELALRSVETTLIVQCLRGSLDSLGFVHSYDQPASRGPDFVVRAGGSVTAGLKDATQTCFAHRVELDRPLQQGETAILELRKTLSDADPPQRGHLLTVPRRTREVLQWFRFNPSYLPDWFDECEAHELSRTVTLSDPRSMHRWRVDFGPGAVLARWGYVEDA